MYILNRSVCETGFTRDAIICEGPPIMAIILKQCYGAESTDKKVFQFQVAQYEGSVIQWWQDHGCPEMFEAFMIWCHSNEILQVTELGRYTQCRMYGTFDECVAEIKERPGSVIKVGSTDKYENELISLIAKCEATGQDDLKQWFELRKEELEPRIIRMYKEYYEGKD